MLQCRSNSWVSLPSCREERTSREVGRCSGSSASRSSGRTRVMPVSFFQGDPLATASIANRLQEASILPLLMASDYEWGAWMRVDRASRFGPGGGRNGAGYGAPGGGDGTRGARARRPPSPESRDGPQHESRQQPDGRGSWVPLAPAFTCAGALLHRSQVNPPRAARARPLGPRSRSWLERERRGQKM